MHGARVAQSGCEPASVLRPAGRRVSGKVECGGLKACTITDALKSSSFPESEDVDRDVAGAGRRLDRRKENQET